MPEVTVYEVYAVTVQVDDSYPRNLRVRPRGVECASLEEAQATMARALALLPHDITTVMVTREHADEDFTEDPDLADWPAERHLRTGDYRLEEK